MIHRLETDRLLLRPFVPDDWRAVHAYASDATVMRYIPGGAMSADQAKAFVGGTDEPVVAAVLKNEGRLIGHLPFHPWYAPQPLIYEIGWIFHPAYHGQGYATEAAAALLRHGFETLQLHRIVATCQPENVASWHVMERLGMRREAHFRKCFQVDEATWLDEYVYALVDEDWTIASGPVAPGASRA